MNKSVININEHQAESAFSHQSAVFDFQFSPDPIIQYKRQRVRKHFEKYCKPGSSILELNAGTGEDALYFARNGHNVHATDISTGMLEVLSGKINTTHLRDKITFENCSFTKLSHLENKGPYDHIFSNFGGLNCTNELGTVLNSFSSLLKQGGCVTLVVMPGFCLIETLLIFKGKIKTAFRRFAGKKSASAHIDGRYFRCWYYHPSFIKRKLKKQFDVLELEGLCSFVPPSYISGFAEKYPRVFRMLKNLEDRNAGLWPWNIVGDYYIITLQKKG